MTHDAFQDVPPPGEGLTAYDKAHLRLYLRLLDAHSENADWTEVVDVLFKIDPAAEPERAQQVFGSHLQRALWLSRNGYLNILGPTRS